MNRRSFLFSTLTSTVLAATAKTFAFQKTEEPASVRLSSLHPRLANQGWGSLLFDRSVDGKPLQIADRQFKHGVSTHARSDLVYLVGGRYSAFHAWVGVDDAASKSEEATARFLVYGDGTKLFDSDAMRVKTPAIRVDIDVTNVNVLRLIVTYVGAHADHVDWAEAELTPDPPVHSYPFSCAQEIISADKKRQPYVYRGRKFSCWLRIAKPQEHQSGGGLRSWSPCARRC